VKSETPVRSKRLEKSASVCAIENNGPTFKNYSPIKARRYCTKGVKITNETCSFTPVKTQNISVEKNTTDKNSP